MRLRNWALVFSLALSAFGQTNIVSADPRFQVSWKQLTNADVVIGWNVSVMDRGTLNVRSTRSSTTNALPLTSSMFPAAGIWDLRVNAFTKTQTSGWSAPLTVNWQPAIISAPKNLRVLRFTP